jgi:CubicO group peptidase (beta-lactamase class C family)
MTSTAITFNAEQRSRRATGYNAKVSPLPPWSGGVIDPAGGLNSTAADMLKFGAAVIDPQNPLKAVFARMTSVKRRHEEPRLQQVLGWSLFRLGANEILGHSGETFGFQARFIVDTTRKRAVIAWINGQGPAASEFAGLALGRAKLQ